MIKKHNIILIAAGHGERYRKAGGAGNKLDQIINGVTVFERALINAKESGLKILVVTRPEYKSIIDICEQKKVPFTCLASSGMGESIAHGVLMTKDADGWIIALADMPYVKSSFYIEVSNYLEKYIVCRPFYNNTPGHPVGFNRSVYHELIGLKNETGASNISKHHNAIKIQCNDPGVTIDVDFPLENEILN